MPAGRGQLDWSPNVNWVEKEGGLPKPIEDLAVELVKKGMNRSRAIATAISRAKHFASTSKDAKVRAKWSKAVADWERLKAKAHARPNANKMKASADVDGEVLVLAAGYGSGYNTEIVTKAFDEQQRQYRVAYRSRNAFSGDSEDIPQLVLKELWTDCIIAYDPGEDQLYKVGYVVTSDRKVYFGDPIKVRLEYVPDEGMMEMGESEDDSEEQGVMMSSNSALDKIMALPLTNSALDKILRG